jgi:hypothetical protein
MSVYNPTGSGNVHVDRIMGTGGKRVAAKSGGAKPAKPKAGGAKKGMGFKAAAANAAKSAGVPKAQGAAIVAAAARRASPAAKRANPNLKKVVVPKTKGKRGGKSGSK